MSSPINRPMPRTPWYIYVLIPLSPVLLVPVAAVVTTLYLLFTISNVFFKAIGLHSKLPDWWRMEP